MPIYETGIASGSFTMDEEADLALLDQHLIKTNALGQRMTSILSQLDTRLSKLDKSITPLGVRELSRKADNLEAILEHLSPGTRKQTSRPAPSRALSNHHHHTSNHSHSQIPATAQVKRHDGPSTPSPSASHHPHPIASSSGSNHFSRPTTSAHPSYNSNHSNRSNGAPADEATLLQRGPDIMSLGEYFGAMESVILDLEQMYKSWTEGRGGAREAGIKDLSELIELGFGNLVQLLLRLVREGMPPAFDPATLVETGPPAPPNYFPPYSTIQPLSTRMAALVNPATPTPRTQAVLMPILNDCIADLAVARGDWLRRAFSSLAAKIDEVDEGGIWDGRGGEKVRLVMSMWEAFVVTVEAETMLVTALLPDTPRLIAQTLPHALNVLITTLNQVINTIKRSLSAQTFVLFDLYSSLISFQPRYETIVSQCLTGTDSREISTALVGPLGILRGLALRSFPELLVDIRTPPRNPSAPSTAIDEVTHSTLAYLEGLPNYGATIDSLLRSSHAERSWLMGAKEPPSSAKSAADEGGVLNLFVADVLGTLIIHLDTRAKSMRRPINFSFLLNNLSHIRNTTSSFSADIIGPGAENMLNRAFREAKTQYLSEWSALVALLTSTSTPRFNVPGTSSDRQLIKEASTAFFDRLAELEASCRQYPLSRQDPDLRDRLGSEVGDLVRSSYIAFWNKGHGKGLDKYLKATPDEVGRRVQAVFR